MASLDTQKLGDVIVVSYLVRTEVAWNTVSSDLPFRGGSGRKSGRSKGTDHVQNGVANPADGQTPTVYPVII